VPASTPNVKLRARIETIIRLIAPALDLTLALGDRLSRLLEPDDPEYVPARMTHGGEAAPRGLRTRRKQRRL
jgi:hypothetical protein